MVVSVFYKRLFRDLLHLLAPILSIAVVIALGIAVLFGFHSTYSSLQTAKQKFYRDTDFADIFASAKKVPHHQLLQFEKWPEVDFAQGGLTYRAQAKLKDYAEPITS